MAELSSGPKNSHLTPVVHEEMPLPCSAECQGTNQLEQKYQNHARMMINIALKGGKCPYPGALALYQHG